MHTPDQKPKHKLHENNSFNKLFLHKKFLGTLSIVPYFNMSVSPMQARSSIFSRAS